MQDTKRRQRRRGWQTVLLGSVLVASGCGGVLTDHSTLGDKGKASFGYDCILTCQSVSQNALAAGGAMTTIGVTLHNGGTYAGVSSSNPSVATLVKGSSGVDATSGVAGTTRLDLIDASGAVIDSTTITVVDSATLAYSQPWSGNGPVVLTGSAQVWKVTTEDSHGRVTIGHGSVAFQLDGPLTLQADPNILENDEVAFVGTATKPTEADLLATAPSTMATLTTTIVSQADLTGVTLSVQSAAADGLGNEKVTVLAVANASAGAVYGTTCTWTPGAGVVIQSQTANDLEHAPGSITQLTVPLHSSSSATCVIGGATASIPLSY